jgi:hypothetical protein
MSRRWAVLSGALLILSACGDDEPGVTPCAEAEAHANSCGLTLQSGCDTESSETEDCVYRCATSAPCGELGDATPETAYFKCQVACYGITDVFVCADGRQFIDAAARCNGVPSCQDGSDEEGCSAGDPPDAG